MKKLLLSFAAFSTLAVNAQNANVQLIHNCASPAAAAVDVYVGLSTATAQKVADNFRFRTATTFLSAPTNLGTLNVYIADSNSSGAASAFYTLPVPGLQADSNYVAIASGVVGTGYEANPNGRSTALEVKIISNVKRTAPAGFVNLAVFHGATDAPGIRVYPRNTTTVLLDSLKYGDTKKYLTVPAAWYQLAVAPEGTFSELNTWYANITGLSGKSAHIFASGFLTPSDDNGGPALDLFAALEDGTVIPLPRRTTAMGQLLHNASDPAADTVDVWVNGTKLYPNFAFRTASPFIPLSAEYPLNIYVCSKGSTSLADSLTPKLTLSLTTSESYVLMAVGLAGTGFVANPDGKNTAVGIKVITPAKISSSTVGNFDFAIVHGATDAPTVDVVARPSTVLANNASYFDATPYISVPANAYVVDVKDSSGANIVASYNAPFDVLSGSASAGVVFASGFLNPAANNNGKAFGLFISLPNGQVLPLSLYTSIKEVSAESFGLKLYPNPARNMVNIAFDAKQNGNAKIEFIDMQGRVVKNVADENLSIGTTNYNVNVSDINSGIYFARITTATEQTNVRFVIE